jgi:hypothetical protein
MHAEVVGVSAEREAKRYREIDCVILSEPVCVTLDTDGFYHHFYTLGYSLFSSLYSHADSSGTEMGRG